jgi:hypothetical protein
VLRLMGTFADAKISAASARLIQSDATRGIGQRLEASDALRASLVAPLDVSPEAAFGEAVSVFVDAGVPPSEPEASPALVLAPAGAASSFGPPSLASSEDWIPLAFGLRASTFAQPDPLKTMDGIDNALRIVPPHSTHVSGPGASMPWTTSTRRPHARQT